MKIKRQAFFIFLLLVGSGVIGFLFSLYQYQKKISAEVQTIETFHYPAIFVEQLKGDKHAGQKIFKEFCSACHNPQPLIDINAPHIGDRDAWKFRKNLGVNVLLQITVSGVGAMPARGGCFECSDEQLKQTILYILNTTFPSDHHS